MHSMLSIDLWLHYVGLVDRDHLDNKREHLLLPLQGLLL